MKEEKIPPDLHKALIANGVAYKIWKDLTPIARNDFTTWIEGAKQKETRVRRIEKTSSMLLSGKRRPCCYAVVPMNLYKELSATPKAKAVWKDLTPFERRDFVAWIDKAKDKESRGLRIIEACMKLAAGKKRP